MASKFVRLGLAANVSPLSFFNELPIVTKPVAWPCYVLVEIGKVCACSPSVKRELVEEDDEWI